MIDINNKNNFTLFIFHWTYKYGNIYFYGICENFGKSKGQNLLQEAPHNVVLSLVTKICIESLNWNLYGITYKRCLRFFFLMFFFFFENDIWNFTVKPAKPCKREIFLECYCVAKKKPIRNEKLNHKQEHLKLVCGFMTSYRVLILAAIGCNTINISEIFQVFTVLLFDYKILIFMKQSCEWRASLKTPQLYRMCTVYLLIKVSH